MFFSKLKDYYTSELEDITHDKFAEDYKLLDRCNATTVPESRGMLKIKT